MYNFMITVSSYYMSMHAYSKVNTELSGTLEKTQVGLILEEEI